MSCSNGGSGSNDINNHSSRLAATTAEPEEPPALVNSNARSWGVHAPVDLCADAAWLWLRSCAVPGPSAPYTSSSSGSGSGPAPAGTNTNTDADRESHAHVDANAGGTCAHACTSANVNMNIAMIMMAQHNPPCGAGHQCLFICKGSALKGCSFLCSLPSQCLSNQSRQQSWS